jgi:hypothetical protein
VAPGVRRGWALFESTAGLLEQRTFLRDTPTSDKSPGVCIPSNASRIREAWTLQCCMMPYGFDMSGALPRFTHTSTVVDQLAGHDDLWAMDLDPRICKLVLLQIDGRN